MQEWNEDIYAHSESPHTVWHREIYADQEYTRPHPSIPRSNRRFIEEKNSMSLTKTQLKFVQDLIAQFIDEEIQAQKGRVHYYEDIAYQRSNLGSMAHDMMDVNKQGTQLKDASNGLKRVLTWFQQIWTAWELGEGSVTSDAEEVIIDTWFIKNVLLARDIFQARLGRDSHGDDEKLIDCCADVFEEGMKRDVKGSSEWILWCEEFSTLARGITACESTSEGALDECFSLTMSEEDAQEYKVLKDHPRDHLLEAYEEVLQRYDWKDFVRKEEPLDEADPDSVKPEGGSSRGSARTSSTCIGSGSEPSLSIETQNPSKHTVSIEQSNISHQGPQV